MKLGVLTRRVGPFALWVWLAAGLAGLIVLRHFRNASTATTPATPASSDTGAAASFGLGSPAVAGGGGDGGQPLQPDQQTPIDSQLANGGTGTPVIFDPTTGDYSSGDNQSGTISPDQPGTIGGPGEVSPGVPFGGARTPKLTLPALPKSTTGQTSKSNKKGGAKPKVAPHPHVVAKATKPAAKPTRNQVHAPAAAVRARSAPAVFATVDSRSAAPPHPAPPPPARGGGRGSAGVTGSRLIRESAATEFAASVAAGYSIYSTLNSSPWTAESFGADPEKARSCLFYSKLATLTNIALGLFTSLIAGSLWPFTGFAVVSLEMHYLYHRAVGKAQRSGSTSFATSAAQGAADHHGVRARGGVR